jgi:metal-dependent amidase/aminoacylase/carboxypeptidase family protein
VTACLEAGAAAAGCDVELAWKSVVYADMLDNQALLRCYTTNAAALGRSVREPGDGRAVVGSTDMGNVSYVVPAIHPMIAAAPAGTAIHTTDFARHARAEPGDRAVVDGAAALACTIADLWLGDGVLAEVRAEFAATIQRVGPDAVRSAIGSG